MLRGQAMFVYEGELAPGAGALPPHILCFSAPLFPSFINQTSMEEIHIDGLISCCSQQSSNLLFLDKLIRILKNVYHKLV